MSTVYDRTVRALQRLHPDLDEHVAYYCGGPDLRCQHRACRAVSQLAEDGLLADAADVDYAAVARDQLRLADDLAETREQLRSNALTAADVHARLELAAVLRQRR